jgi:hypothetical protein
MTKYNLLSTFNVRWDTILDDCKPWILKNKKYVYAYNYIKAFLNKDIDGSIKEVQLRHNEKYEIQLIENAEVYEAKNYSSDSEEDDFSYLTEEEKKKLPGWQKCLKQLRKEDVRATVVHSIQYNKKWLKIKTCLEFLQAMGFKTLKEPTDNLEKDKENGLVISPNWTRLHDYCRQNEERIRALFENKKMSWEETLTNVEKKNLSQFVNQKLESTIGIKFTSNTRRVWYTLNFLFQPDIPEPLIESKDLEETPLSLDVDEDNFLSNPEDPEEEIEAFRTFSNGQIQDRRKKRELEEKKREEEEEPRLLKLIEERKEKRKKALEQKKRSQV